VQRKFSNRQIIPGINPVVEALREGLSIYKVFLDKQSDNPKLKEIIALCKESGIPFSKVPVEKLHRMTGGKHQGVIAFKAPISFVSFEEIIQRCFEEGKDPRVLLLDEVSDVRNFGSICRSAKAFGFDVVIVPFKGSAAITDDAVSTSAGAILHLSVSRVPDLAFTIRQLQDYGLNVVGLTEKSDKSLSENDPTGPIALVMGNEENGISDRVAKCCNELVRINMDTNNFDSLNVSVAAGIAMHHFYPS
jgi:23S rRNA (guanosine2251-2'-O)-methyltransferase